jgi:hypothetical protein
MTADRAKYILANRLLGGDFRFAFRKHYNTSGSIHSDGITPDEDEAVRALWETMPGYTSYYDAIVRIAKGPRQELLGDLKRFRRMAETPF